MTKMNIWAYSQELTFSAHEPKLLNLLLIGVSSFEQSFTLYYYQPWRHDDFTVLFFPFTVISMAT